MADAVPVRIHYVGPDDPVHARFPPSRTEIVKTTRLWKQGEELLPTHPGVYVWEADFHRGGNVHATYAVRLTPPPTDPATPS
ncbi:MAG: hypothetical protein ACXVRZ_00815 [Gaiellaceae bacterium]